MSEYYKSINKNPWNALPVTFHIDNGLSDPEYQKFLEYHRKLDEEITQKTRHKYEELERRRKEEIRKRKLKKLKDKGKKGKAFRATESESSISDLSETSDSDEEEESSDDDEFKIPKNIWIVKPGENSNRGNGIQVCSSLQEINNIVRTCRPRQEASNVDTAMKVEDNQRKTFIVQKYIDRPLLINQRKFDIRAFGLMTSTNGLLKGYFYEDGYIRTSSKEYTSRSNDIFIHLTNDAVQKKSEDFGKFENSNKLSYNDFQKHIKANYSHMNICFYRDILPQMRKLM